MLQMFLHLRAVGAAEADDVESSRADDELLRTLDAAESACVEIIGINTNLANLNDEFGVAASANEPMDLA